jgi:hypothetical protein
MDPEVVVNTRYDTAVRTAANFLSVFLGKCGVKNNEEVDYRPLFENFVQVRVISRKRLRSKYLMRVVFIRIS